MSLTSYSGTVPDRSTDTTSEFNTNVQNMLDWFAVVVPEIDTELSSISTLSNTASAAATSALAAGSASLYASETTYDDGDGCIDSINYQFYRCTSDSTAGVQPSTNTDGTWVRVLVGGVNPNLVINSNFSSNCNQEEYDADGVASLTDGSYGHDMWKAVGGSLIYTKESNGDIVINSFTAASATNVYLYQKNDELINTNGETLTVSFEVVSLSDSVRVGGNGMTLQTISTTGKKSFTYTSSGLGTIHFYRVFTGAGTDTVNFRFKNLKVERGAQATDCLAPEPRTERERCNYYYRRLNRAADEVVAEGLYYSSAWRFVLPTPGGMRTTPSISANSTFSVFTTSGNTASSFAVTALFEDGVQISCTAGSPATGDRGTLFSSNAASYIELDARY